MSTNDITTYQLNSILKGLEDALKVTKDPKIINEFGHPYCHGYLEASVSNTIFELKSIINNK